MKLFTYVIYGLLLNTANINVKNDKKSQYFMIAEGITKITW